MRKALAGILLISACAHHPRLAERMQDWMGKDVNDLITKIGPPSSTFQMPNGNTIYIWTRTGPVRADYKQELFGGPRYAEITQNSCTCRYTANPSNTLVNWAYEGNCGR